MRQALHILWKDMRRHWPEIVLVALTTGFWVVREPRTWAPNYVGSGWEESAPGILIAVLWLIAVARVVHGEPLVGDRQFWQTRPYQWQSLLAAKALFVMLFVLGPLALGDVWLLWRSGLHAEWIWAPSLIWQQGLLFVLILVPMMALAAITENLVQYVMGLLGLGLVIAGATWLGTQPWQDAPTGSGTVPNILAPSIVILGAVGIVLWQFARRRTGLGRLAFASCVLAAIGISYLSAWHTMTENTYRPAKVGGWPTKVTFESADGPGTETLTFVKPVAGSVGKDARTVAHYPVTVSGIPAGFFGFAEGSRVVLDGPGGFHWESRWMLPNTDSKTPMLSDGETDGQLIVVADNTLLEKLPKGPVEMHMELAFSEYQDGQPVTVRVAKHFSVPGEGECEGSPGRHDLNDLHCRAAFKKADFVLWRFDPAKSTCTGPGEGPDAYEHAVGYATEQSDTVGLANVMWDPVLISNPYFSYWSPSSERSFTYLCPGTPLEVSHPTELGRARKVFDLGQVRLRVVEASLDYEFQETPKVTPKAQHVRPRGRHRRRAGR